LGLDRVACRGLQPDLTIYLDLDLETGLARARARNLESQDNETRMDDQAAEFHRRVRDAYLELARRESDRIRVIDASRGEEAVAADIWQAVLETLERPGV
jgi:dTMP kinase